MPYDCMMCEFFSMYDGTCGNPNSPYFAEDRIEGAVCDCFEKEKGLLGKAALAFGKRCFKEKR